MFVQPLKIIVAFSLALATAGPLVADDESKRKRHDHEVARRALASGEIRPLETVIAEVRKSTPGEIVGIELEKYSGQWVYKIKVITPAGSMQKVTIDARGNEPQAGGGSVAVPPAPDARSR